MLRVTAGTLFSSSVLSCISDAATTEIYTLSLHDALPICRQAGDVYVVENDAARLGREDPGDLADERSLAGAVRADKRDRKSTRLNSSHANISYAVFCLKKKTKNEP